MIRHFLIIVERHDLNLKGLISQVEEVTEVVRPKAMEVVMEKVTEVVTAKVMVVVTAKVMAVAEEEKVFYILQINYWKH